MLEIIRGTVDKPASTETLINFLKKIEINEGILYLGYPIIGALDGNSSLDAVLVSPGYDIVIFDIIEGKVYTDRTETQDDIYNRLKAKLLQNKPLIKSRGELAISINIVTYAPLWKQTYESKDISTLITEQDIIKYLSTIQKEQNIDTYRKLVAAIQTVTNIKTKSKRLQVKKSNSRGEKLKKLETSIANLDAQQSKAVIETVDGIQRIRGLAGSGKTIVLALKVAYLHSTHPDWLIGVTFNTRSLKSQFKELITKFTIEQKSEEPDWDRIKILQAWGSSFNPGIYYDTCKNNNIEYYDYKEAVYKIRKNKNEEEFDAVCKKALQECDNFKEVYDALLIDEAQDFTESFLKLCYKILKKPKRLVFAYDELQKLNDSSLRNPKEIFGQEVVFENNPDKPKQDIFLEKCYRNSRPILVSAHSLGFGIYRKEGLVQMFDQPQLWNDVGYVVNTGELNFGRHVILERTSKTSPLFLEEHSPIEDIIQIKTFSTYHEQIQWIANEIEKNLTEDELEYNDIIVIHSNPLKTKQDVGPLRNLLFDKKINSHLAGVSTSPDDFFAEGSITFTSIYRAKGNEAAMIYIMNSQETYSGLDLMRKRNILFTALTRSRAWVRACGYGSDMKLLNEEFDKAKKCNFKLDFTLPTKEELKKINLINRDMTLTEQKKITTLSYSLKDFLEEIEAGTMHVEDLPEEIRKSFKQILNNEK